MKVKQSIASFKSTLTNLLKEGTDNSAHQIIPFAILVVFTTIPFYIINQKTFSGVYENLALRIISTALCIPLIVKNYWPDKLKKLLPVWWYVTLWHSLPFFFLFMALKNDMSSMWQVNMVLLVLFLVLLVDWISFILIISLGFILAYLAYSITSHTFALSSNQQGGLIEFGYFILIYALFSRNNQRIEKEKLQVMRSMGATIAHELRTPLRTIHSSVGGIKDFLPALIQTYQMAKQNNLDVPYISPLHYEGLLSACDDVEVETNSAFNVVEMLLMNVGQNQISTDQFKICAINQCIVNALHRYPFDAGEAELVFYEEKADFKFMGDELLFTHVLFNLLKNALYFIKAAGKGDIHIWTERDGEFNRLHFKDTGKGIAKEILPHIFDRFYSKTRHGVGVGLSFCKMVMKSFNGDIKCSSEEGKYTEFVLYFPTKHK